MEDFDRTPFADPFFAAIAAEHGHGPEHLVLNSNGGTPFFGEVEPAGMPGYTYGRSTASGEAHLCLHMKDERSSYNYTRSSDGARILFFRETPSQAERQSLKGGPLSALVNTSAAEGYVITAFAPIGGRDGFQAFVEHPQTKSRRAETPLEEIGRPTMLRCLSVTGRTMNELGAIGRDRSARVGTSVLIVSLECDEDTLATTGWLTNTMPSGSMASVANNGVAMIEGPPMHDWMIGMILGCIRKDADRLNAKAVLYQHGGVSFAIHAEVFGPD